ncbi:MAG: site-specific integrase [Thaumarchaeota archaeon]|nr:site-specific integrase [Nitrososphaerota archaeon]
MPRKPKDLPLVRGKASKPFEEAIGSPVTREVYKRRLQTFLEYAGMDVDELVGKAKGDPAWAQELITEYLLKEKNRAVLGEIESSSVRNVKKPVRLLLDMNDVSGINWKKISRMLPSARRYALDRAPTLDELRFLSANTEARFQAVLLTMVSSGIRVGAWDYLNWGDVEPIKRDGQVVAAKLKIYRGEPEEYFTFITPEAYSKLKQYIELRESHGEKVTKDSPLARDRWEANSRGSPKGDIREPKRLQSSGVKRLFEDMLWKFGIRKPLKEKEKRHEFSIHSLRKFFKTRAEQVMKPINVETLMGHSTGISDSYYRPTEKELLDDYLKAVPLLTISEVEEVRQQSQVSRKELEGRLRQVEDLLSKLIAEKGQPNPSPDHNRNGDTSNGNTKKVVTANEAEELINQGWEPMMTLPNGKVVLRAF